MVPRFAAALLGPLAYTAGEWSYPVVRCFYPASAGYGGYTSPWDPYGLPVYGPPC